MLIRNKLVRWLFEGGGITPVVSMSSADFNTVIHDISAAQTEALQIRR